MNLAGNHDSTTEHMAWIMLKKKQCSSLHLYFIHKIKCVFVAIKNMKHEMKEKSFGKFQ